MEVLLKPGADPRLYADDGSTPEQVCVSAARSTPSPAAASPLPLLEGCRAGPDGCGRELQGGPRVCRRAVERLPGAWGTGQRGVWSEEGIRQRGGEARGPVGISFWGAAAP